MATAVAGATGKIVQITGSVVDIEFPTDQLPEIYNAIDVPLKDGGKLVLEAQQHLGNDWVRCVAMSTTDGLVRGMEARDTGAPIQVPPIEDADQFDLRPGIRLIECQTDHRFIVRAANRSGALPAPSSCEPREEIGQVEIVERQLRAAE